MGKRYLTTQQVMARYGGKAAITIKRWVDAGRIDPPLRIGNRDYYDEEKLDASDRRHQRARANPPKHTPPQRKQQEAPREP